jgi:purine-binding chemotaxis protein CheW
MNSVADQKLVCRVGRSVCSLPLECVVETFRPLPIERLAEAPPFVLGLSVVRGEPLPVVDLLHLIAGRAGKPTRFVVVKAAERRVALAVDEVIGVRMVSAERMSALPPLLRDADSAIVSAVGTLDSELFMVLQASRLLPEGFLDGEGAQRLAS